MLRALIVSFVLFVASPAFAGPIAVVDFQRAVTETDQGKAAQKKIDDMYETRRAEIERMQRDLEKQIQDFQARAMILSDEARAEQEQQLMLKQQQFQQRSMQYEVELQQTYSTLLADLDQKMRALAATIAKDKGYDLVLDSAVVVYMGGSVVDMTSELVARYNKTHKQ